MSYVYLNKETNNLLCFGSITALCKNTGIKPDNLYTNFNRKGLKEFENEKYRIVKTEVIRSK